MKIIPLYTLKSRYLIGLEIDFSEEKVLDGLVVEIDIHKKIILNQPWSCQKKLKFGYYDGIKDSEREHYINLIRDSLGKNLMIEIVDLLLYPTKESIESLIWIPDRLKNGKT